MAEKLVLPIKKSEKDMSYAKQKFGMIGAAGIGKSEFWAQDKDAFFIEAEQGLNFLEVFKMPARNFEDLRNIFALLKEAELSGKFPYSIVVIDTIDRIVDYAEEEIVTRAKSFYTKMANEINTVGDIPNGAGWYKCKDLVMNFLNKLAELPCAIAYVGHLNQKTFKDGVREVNKNTISIGGKLGLELLAWTDHTLHVEAHMMGDKLRRKVWTKPTQSKEAKSRGGVLPDGWEWKDDMKENYKYLRSIFT